MRGWLRRGAALAVLSLVAAACGGDGGGGGGGASGSASPQQGGVLAVGSSSSIDSLNPFKGYSQMAYVTFMYIYPVLVQYDANLEFVPDYATSWEVAPDGTSITFTLASGGTWSDGQPVTAQDAKWTFDTIMKYSSGPTSMMGGYMKHIASVEAPDDTTFVVNYEVPVNTEWALSQLNQVYVLPQHVWSQHEGDDGKDLKTFPNDPPVSGGPFTLTKNVKNDYAQFQANPGYYGPKPFIEGFGVKFYANIDEMMTAFLNGELDTVTSVPPATLERVRSTSGVQVLESPGLMFYDLIFNSKAPIHPEILDPQVRHAIASAIDYQEIIDTALLGTATLGTTIVPPATPKWHDASVQQFPFDIAAANKMLDDAGYTKGSDGIRTANGEPMEYDVLMPQNLDFGDRIFEIIQQGTDQIGIKLNLKALDSDTVWTMITGSNGDGYDQFDISLWDWVALVDPDFILSVLTCEQIGGWSDTGYCNKEYDKLYTEQGQAVVVEDRQQIVNQMQQIIFDDSPYIVLFYQDQIEANYPDWDGFNMGPQGSINSRSKLTLEQVHMAA